MAAKKAQWLSPSEIERAERFRRQEDQRCYVLAHALKRFYLSRLLGLAPQALTFSAGDKGKPFCCSPNAPFFNISHSGDWVLLGLSMEAELGVDVELAQRDISEATASYVLTAAQVEQARGAADSRFALMTYWTQKEAISKALGLGLSIDFKTIACSGQLGASQVEHSGQRLNVDSRLLDEDYLMASATVSPQPLELYRVQTWSEAEASLVPL